MTPGIAVIPGLGAVADRYDAFLVDLWGCLHNGIEAFPEAVAALGRLRPKPVCLLSNGPRRASVLIERLDGMGIGRDLYDAVMSSGESAWAAIGRGDGIPPGRRCHHIGSGRDLSVREGNGVIAAERIGDADFILCTDIRRRGETLADYEAELARGVGHGLPMVCANPDLAVHVGDRLEICAGALAARYEELGGRVSYHGKPHRRFIRRRFGQSATPVHRGHWPSATGCGPILPAPTRAGWTACSSRTASMAGRSGCPRIRGVWPNAAPSSACVRPMSRPSWSGSPRDRFRDPRDPAPTQRERGAGYGNPNRFVRRRAPDSGTSPPG